MNPISKLNHYYNNDLNNKQPLGSYANSSHTHNISDINSLSNIINDSTTTSVGIASRTSNATDGGCYWFKYGKLVTLYFYDVQINSSVNGASQTVLFTGIPKAANMHNSGSTSMIVSMSGKSIRIGISSYATNVSLWYSYFDSSLKYSGQLQYISE